mmetsp:Transcript_3444/g.4998  ORF Transcript_3444/g.4998 Transcript_3444/m.4998 type:complete len:406 (+) Transcript_3444:141-1358(+)
MVYLSDLPTGALAHVSSFLASPSRALFAVALDYRDVDSSSAIAGDDWDVLDFGEIEKELAAKISDEDIRGVLLSIDAVNNLKKLRLTNCIHVTGVGLGPLRGSTIIQQIDLSLVGDHESPRLDPEPLISCAEVIPILDSIIERGEDCSLEYLQFPKVWRKERNTESDFHAFLTRFNNYLSSRAGRCLQCRCNLPIRNRDDQHNMLYMSAYDKFYGTQKYTCYDCTKQYCEDCEDDGGVYYIGGTCDKCERRYCLHCKKVDVCTSCDNCYCVDCIDFKQCPQCDENTCPDCVSEVRCRNTCCADKISCNNCAEDGNAFSWCESCNEAYCVDCCNSDVLHTVQDCDDCYQSLCDQCRMKTCREGRNCTGCYQIAFKALTEDKETLRNENEELRSEINELKRKIGDGA